MPVIHVPTPCPVYVKSQSLQGAYVFSHCCKLSTQKAFPASLRTTDLRAFDTRQNWIDLRKTTFVVLVSGDVAQCVSVSNASDRLRTRFLYNGSAYARKMHEHCSFPSELHDSSISLHFHATMAVFDARRHALSAVIPLECGVCLFPKQILESDLPSMARWVEACMKRSLASSVWVTACGDSYNEHSRSCNPRLRKIQV